MVCGTQGKKSASALLASGRTKLCGVLLNAAAADATLTIYDNTAASGTIVFETTVTVALHKSAIANFPKPVQLSTGMYASLSGAGASYIVYQD